MRSCRRQKQYCHILDHFPSPPPAVSPPHPTFFCLHLTKQDAASCTQRQVACSAKVSDISVWLARLTVTQSTVVTTDAHVISCHALPDCLYTNPTSSPQHACRSEVVQLVRRLLHWAGQQYGRIATLLHSSCHHHRQLTCQSCPEADPMCQQVISRCTTRVTKLRADGTCRQPLWITLHGLGLPT